MQINSHKHVHIHISKYFKKTITTKGLSRGTVILTPLSQVKEKIHRPNSACYAFLCQVLCRAWLCMWRCDFEDWSNSAVVVGGFCMCPKGRTSLFNMHASPFSLLPDPQREERLSAVRAIRSDLKCSRCTRRGRWWSSTVSERSSLASKEHETLFSALCSCHLICWWLLIVLAKTS